MNASDPRFVPDGLPRVWVSRHAADRIREHHPHAGVNGCRALLAIASPVQPEVVAGLLGRSLEGVRDRYLVAADRRGVFVVAAYSEATRPGSDALPETLVTYVRLSPSQVEAAVRLWPVEP